MKKSTLEEAEFLAVGLNKNSSLVLHETKRIRRKLQIKLSDLQNNK
jgi:hypothetical protein